MRSILVVENYASLRRGIVQTLQLAGFTTVEAASGLDALEYLRSGGGVHAILLDLVMPDMNGWEFQRAQQQDAWLSDIPVIVLSALDGHPVTGVTAAATLKKPVAPKLLIETVRAVCDLPARRRPRAQGRAAS